jgi:hypothetical protein
MMILHPQSLRGKKMADHTFIRIMVAILLLTGLCLGGLDQSGSIGAKNLTLSDFDALVPQSSADIAASDLGAPQAAASNAGTEVAAYTQQAPPTADLRALQPSAILSNPPRYMYYSGKYLSWSDFSVKFPSNQPGLWIERAVSWSTYATLPWGGWARELIYVPTASPVTMYEIYPDGYVIAYSLGFVQPGYYNIWYYADEPGRHRSMIATNSGYSNQVIIDVYGAIGTIITPKPTPQPDPQKACEAKGWPWQWVNGECVNVGPAPNPVAECEAKGWPWQWVNGECVNVGPAPNPVAECEKNPLCHYVDGQCLCTGAGDTEKQNCEANPLCDYVNGQCYCRGGEAQPMPGPVPNPNPEPFNPAPNPVSQCESNPGCQWSNGQCLCTGLGSSNSGGDDGSDSSGNLEATS